MSALLRRSRLVQACLLLLVGVALLWITSPAQRYPRIDLTEDGLFTISDGTRAMLAQLEQPVELWWFRSESVLRDAPALRNYALRIGQLLEEMVRLAGGDLRLHSVDPQPLSEQEDRASQWGIQAVPVEAGEPALYLGLAAVGSSGSKAVLPFLHPSRQRFLEYDIARAIAGAGKLRPGRIGLISGLPVSGGVDVVRRVVNRPWTSIRELGNSYQVEDLGLAVTAIAEDIDLLLLIQPGELSEQALLAIDQYVLSGRPAMVFLDPIAESAGLATMAGDGVGGVDPSRPGLVDLLDAWGVGWSANRVVGDAAHAMLMNLGDDQVPARDLTLLGVGTPYIAGDAMITRALESLNLATAGAWVHRPDARSRWQPLVWSSRGSALIDQQRVRQMRHPGELFDDFIPDGRTHALVGLLSGEAASAFPEAQPARAEGVVNVLLVGDSDILTDRLWVQVQGFMSQPVLAPFADNGALLINAADYLTGQHQLIDVRGRGVLERPFSRVHDLRNDAEARYRDQADALSEQLREAEQQLAALEAQTSLTDRDSLEQGQRDGIEHFIDLKLQLRKALRVVQRQLTVETDTLGARLKWINIALVPLLLGLLLGVHLLLRQRRC